MAGPGPLPRILFAETGPDRRIALPRNGQYIVIHLDVVLQVAHACQLQRGRIGTAAGIHAAEGDDAPYQYVLAGALLRIGHHRIATHTGGQAHDPWPQLQFAFLRHVDADVVDMRVALRGSPLRHLQCCGPIAIVGHRLHAHAPCAIGGAMTHPCRVQHLSQRLHHVAGRIALLRQDRALGQHQQRGGQPCGTQHAARYGDGHRGGSCVWNPDGNRSPVASRLLDCM
ncbi:hypothetical protein G6F22_016204 [Rhizopus arrhizus]|nr:hypothetical protein G6F22_016204 [Rhizopus arrhizus]